MQDGRIVVENSLELYRTCLQESVLTRTMVAILRCGQKGLLGKAPCELDMSKICKPALSNNAD